MQDEVHKRILEAILVVLRPMARILLRFGIGYREFAEVAKRAFVDVATSDYGIRGRHTNISRIAVMTGLTRKEAKRLRDGVTWSEERLSVRTNPLKLVLHRWHTEDEFMDRQGRPATLPFTGTSASFTELVRHVGGDFPPGAMRTELKRIGAIREDEDGNLTVVRRSLAPDGTHDNLVAALTNSAYPLLATIAHNSNVENPDDRLTQQTAITRAVKSSDVLRIRRISAERLAGVAGSFEELFRAYEALHESDDDPEQPTSVAVGVFYFEDTDQSTH